MDADMNSNRKMDIQFDRRTEDRQAGEWIARQATNEQTDRDRQKKVKERSKKYKEREINIKKKN